MESMKHRPLPWNARHVQALISMLERHHSKRYPVRRFLPFILFLTNVFAFAEIEESLSPSASPLPVLWFSVAVTGFALLYLAVLVGNDAARALRVAISAGWDLSSEVFFVLRILSHEASTFALAISIALGYVVHFHGAGTSVPVGIISSGAWYAGTVMGATAIVTLSARRSISPSMLLGGIVVSLSALFIGFPETMGVNLLYALPVAGWLARSLWSDVLGNTMVAFLWSAASVLMGCCVLLIILHTRE